MTNHQIALKGLNITIVYQSLSINDVNRQLVKELLGDKDKIITTEFPPDLLVFINPINTTVIQFGDRRVRITNQSGIYTDLSQYAVEIHLSNPKLEMVAFGLNYDFEIGLQEQESVPAIANIFGKSLANYLEKLESTELVTFLPRVLYLIDGARHDLILEPPMPNVVGAHLNVHFETNQLPGRDELAALQQSKFEYAFRILNNLLG